MTDREIIELFDRFAKLKAEYHDYTCLIEPYTRDIPTMLEWYDNIRGKVDVRAKTDEEILEEIKKTEMYAQCVKELGERAALEMLQRDLDSNHTPACCYRCVYQQSCDLWEIAPWSMLCGKFIRGAKV